MEPILTESPAFLTAMLPIVEVLEIQFQQRVQVEINGFDISYDPYIKEVPGVLPDSGINITDEVEIFDNLTIFKANFEDENYYNYLNLEEVRGVVQRYLG